MEDHSWNMTVRFALFDLLVDHDRKFTFHLDQSSSYANHTVTYIGIQLLFGAVIKSSVLTK
jgi:hypothetical protein